MVLAGIVVVRHHEPYGYFSVDTPEFAAQFVRKNIRDRFRVGQDIDAVSTATMSRVQKVVEMLNIQAQPGNWNHDRYMHGMSGPFPDR